MGIVYQDIRVGDVVRVRSATGEYLPRRAATGVERGHNFPVVFVCTEEEWQASQRENRLPNTAAWPAEDVETTTS